MAVLKCKQINSKNKPSQGFTMLELVLVIIVMGIMAVGISGFISLSTQTYINATTRDELIGNARFAIERLSRELRNAVPNSIRTESWFGDQVQCIQFIPIKASTVYTDIPVAPEPASNVLSVIPFNNEDGTDYQCDDSAGCSDIVIAYPLNEDDIYDNYTTAAGKTFRIGNVDTSVEPWNINISSGQNITFDEDSPTQRLYIADSFTQINYCVFPISSLNTGVLVRIEENISSGDQSFPAGSAQEYMAGYLADISGALPFHYEPATLKRNGVVQMHLHFTKDDENYVFDHEIHINNVP